MQTSLRPPSLSPRVSAGLLVLRIVLGLAFVQYGLMKAPHPFGWAASIGMPGLPPLVLASVVVAELGGGLLLLFGALTPVAGALVALDMLGAMLTFAIPHGGLVWISSTPRLTIEKNLIYGAAALTLALAGPGAYSIDAMLTRDRIRMGTDGLPAELSSSATS